LKCKLFVVIAELCTTANHITASSCGTVGQNIVSRLPYKCQIVYELSVNGVPFSMDELFFVD
jgi:hypothetical protein